MPQFEAVLFDMDGVLVDSELQANTVWVALLAEHGLKIDLPTFMAQAVGGTHVVLFEWLRQTYGWTRPESFIPELDARLHEAFGSTQAIEGAAQTLELLQQSGLPFAVASNSLRSRLTRKLEAAGLASLVGTHAYDPAHVGGRGKPAPDLYAHAAAQLGVKISRCVVVEDSVTGLSAGVTAGATAWGLLAGGHIHPDNAVHLLGAGAARILRTHGELQAALGLSAATDVPATMAVGQTRQAPCRPAFASTLRHGDSKLAPMSHPFTPKRPLRVAVIGSGPSGVYAAEALIKQTALPAEVDVFDRLPTPYGLVRYGVAPDHLTIKSVTKGFEKTFSDPRVRFLGNVEFGKDLTHDDLKAHYDAVMYTVGASGDRRLGIPGEDLSGSMSATEFVAWYNGHPDAAAREMVLSATGVAVVGVGNVALDVSRILLKTVEELRESDIAPHALEVLESSPVTDVWILGRRGAAQAKFTTKELREFGELSDAEPVVRPDEVTVDQDAEAAITDNVVKKNLEVIRDFSGRTPAAKSRRVHLRFLVSPVEILGDDQGNVSGLKIERNTLDDAGNAVGTGETEVLPVQMVLRSVGYRGVALPGVPFDEKRGVIPNTEGRVEGRAGEYTSGWIKRGPSGVIGTNRKDATDTVAHLIADAGAGELPAADDATRAGIDTLLQERGVDVYTFADWQALDTHEQAQGKAQGRPRAKVVHRHEMLGHRRK